MVPLADAHLIHRPKVHVVAVFGLQLHIGHQQLAIAHQLIALGQARGVFIRCFQQHPLHRHQRSGDALAMLKHPVVLRHHFIIEFFLGIHKRIHVEPFDKHSGVPSILPQAQSVGCPCDVPCQRVRVVKGQIGAVKRGYRVGALAGEVGEGVVQREGVALAQRILQRGGGDGGVVGELEHRPVPAELARIDLKGAVFITAVPVVDARTSVHSQVPRCRSRWPSGSATGHW
jgi:hypothetical protein